MQHAGSDLKAHISAAQLIAPRQVDELELFTEGIGYAIALFSSGLWKVKDVKARESLLTLRRIVQDFGVYQKHNKSRRPKPLLYCVRLDMTFRKGLSQGQGDSI